MLRGLALCAGLLFLATGCSFAGPAATTQKVSDDVGTADVLVAPDVPGPPEDTGPPPPPPPLELVVDRDVRDRLPALINAAHTRIDVLHFSFTQTGSSGDVMAALKAAKARGVDVRVLLDDEPEANPDAVAALKSVGISAKLDNNNTRLHLKAFAIDGEVLFIGSTNLSGSALDFNHEANWIVRDPDALQFFEAYFAGINANPNYTLNPASSTSDSGAIQMWGRAGFNDVAIPAIESAKVSVDVIIYGINLDPNYPDGPAPDLAQALYDAEARSVPVRVLFELSDWNDGLNERNQHAAALFSKAGIQIRYDSEETVTHAKVLITDDRVFVGTNNWSYQGLHLGHEGGLATTLEQPVAATRAYFEAQWAAAAP